MSHFVLNYHFWSAQDFLFHLHHFPCLQIFCLNIQTYSIEHTYLNAFHKQAHFYSQKFAQVQKMPFISICLHFCSKFQKSLHHRLIYQQPNRSFPHSQYVLKGEKFI